MTIPTIAIQIRKNHIMTSARGCSFMILPMHLILLIDTYVCECRPILSQVCRYFRLHLHFQHVTLRTSRTFSYVHSSVARIRLLRIDLTSRVSRVGAAWRGHLHKQVDEMHVITAYERFHFQTYRDVLDLARQSCCQRLKWLTSSVPQNPGQMVSLVNKVLCFPFLRDVYIDCSWCNLGQRHINKIVCPSSSRVTSLCMDLSFNIVYDLQPMLRKIESRMPNLTTLCIILHEGCAVHQKNMCRFLQNTNIRSMVIKIGTTHTITG